MSLLALRGLRKSFGGLAVAQDISFDLAAGERVALIGPNGAGKTSLVNMVTGHLRPDAGQVAIAGRDMSSTPPRDRVQAGLVRSFQVTRLFDDLTPADHIALALLQRQGRVRRMLGDWRRTPGLPDQVAEILAGFDLAGAAGHAVATMPYGRQRLLEIALAMALRPRVLLLDEPAAGVPAADIALIEAALDRLPTDLAVLLIDHDMGFVFRFARRVIVLAEGRVIFDGAPAAAAADRGVRAAYLGGAA